MEAIQRRAAWFVAQDFSRYSSVQSFLNDLEWTPLKDHQRNIRLTFIFRVVTGRVAVQSEGTLSPADNRTRHKHNTSINTYQQPVTSAWTLSLSKLSPIGTPYQRRASQRILLPHSSHACANPHSAALRYPPIDAILFRGLPIPDPEPEPDHALPMSMKTVFWKRMPDKWARFCLLLTVSPDYALPITGQVTEVTCPVIGRAQPELTPSKRQKGPVSRGSQVLLLTSEWNSPKSTSNRSSPNAGWLQVMSPSSTPCHLGTRQASCCGHASTKDTASGTRDMCISATNPGSTCTPMFTIENWLHQDATDVVN